jgi:hypothetical protein
MQSANCQKKSRISIMYFGRTHIYKNYLWLISILMLIHNLHTQFVIPMFIIRFTLFHKVKDNILKMQNIQSPTDYNTNNVTNADIARLKRSFMMITIMNSDLESCFSRVCILVYLLYIMTLSFVSCIENKSLLVYNQVIWYMPMFSIKNFLDFMYTFVINLTLTNATLSNFSRGID